MKVISAYFGGCDYNGNFDAIIFVLKGNKGTAETRRPSTIRSWKEIDVITVVTDTDVFKIKI